VRVRSLFGRVRSLNEKLFCSRGRKGRGHDNLYEVQYLNINIISFFSSAAAIKNVHFHVLICSNYERARVCACFHFNT
jgi:hypothetical protein